MVHNPQLLIAKLCALPFLTVVRLGETTRSTVSNSLTVRTLTVPIPSLDKTGGPQK